MVRNTSSLHNEFLGHRLSLVPLGFDENQLRALDPANGPSALDPAAYKCVLKVKNDAAVPRAVTTADFEVFDAAGAKRPASEARALFPASPVTGDHILLARLKPGEEVHAECVPSIGCGRQHARWSPVSRCFFRNKIDPVAVEASLAARKAALIAAHEAAGSPPPTAAEVTTLMVQHATSDAHRCFLKDAFGEPAAFEFVVETETVQRPAYVVFAAFVALIDSVEAVRTALTLSGAEGSGTGGRVTVESYPNMDDFYQVTVRGADHTLGNLVQGLLYRLWVREGEGREVSYIGYYQPHPLEDGIVFKIKCTGGSGVARGGDVRTRFADGLGWVAERLRDLVDAWIAGAGTGLAGAGIVAVNEWSHRRTKAHKGAPTGDPKGESRAELRAKAKAKAAASGTGG